MVEVPVVVWLLMAALMLASGTWGLRGFLELLSALRHGELDRLAQPAHWPAIRLLAAVIAALPLLVIARGQGMPALWLAVIAGGAVFWLAPQGLRAARRHVEQRILDDLPLHLDLMAVAMEAGCTWPAALSACVEHADEGPLRRAWQRVSLEIQAGAEPLDALRGLELRLRLAPFATLVSALRAAEKLRLPAAMVLRERARQAAASRFARAERRARAAPLRLWAVMVLCLVPCTAAALAIPLALLWSRWLA
jgi:Flp pilus assembly protein TadB